MKIALIIFGSFMVLYMLGFGILFRGLHCQHLDYGVVDPRLKPRGIPGKGDQKLAVVVPVHAGDIDRAIESLSRWPTLCAPSTLKNTDLVIYHAKDGNKSVVPSRILETISRCFRSARVVGAKLSDEENIYPTGPSAQFYKMFLDPGVREHFQEYQALAVVEWDVIIAHDSSFERLYAAAFSTSEPFWIKGSTLAGTEFHQTATLPNMWHVLGHLNGNAIYNNTDLAFVEYVNYTFSRWKYTYPYDVALWATIADFPYSWTLWQRYSSKFVATNLISNVGFTDVNDRSVRMAIASDTLLIHGSSKSAGKISNTRVKSSLKVHTSSEGCLEACGLQVDPTFDVGISSVCDPTCLADDPHFQSRFHGYLCGAGDPSRYGDGCRQCYRDRGKALVADRTLATATLSTARSNSHVTMCDTMRPPESTTCSEECDNDRDTICDSRCKSGLYGDLHCNWRDLGASCRYCFHDFVAARLADEIAKETGGRVLMCNTHEPPHVSADTRAVSNGTSDTVANRGTDGVDFSDIPTSSPEQKAAKGAAEGADFPRGITRANICAFIPGYFEYISETNLLVSSILQFMPGMKIVVATSSLDFHVYNKTLGPAPTLSIVIASNVQFAALVADWTCGEGSTLIYYVGPGQVLSRAFNGKDTHTPTGDLVVAHTDVQSVGKANADRSMIATAVLGFHAPSFTYGVDLILPAHTNSQLRAVLYKAAGVIRPSMSLEREETHDREADVLVIQHYVTELVTKRLDMGVSIYIPEILAALSFMRNTDGVRFIDINQWSRDNVFKEPSIWDIPLVRPRFSCSMDVALSLAGYDVAAELRDRISAFGHGARCDEGYVVVDPGAMKTKTDWEFGAHGSIQKHMPSMIDFRVSIMYRTFFGDVDLFNISLPTVMHHFQDALELVVVVEENDEELFNGILSRYRNMAPFPLRLVTEPSIMDGHIQQKFSKMRADLYTEGDFILHLDSDVFLFENVTYDHIFHLGKPVLPFRRYRDGTPEDLSLLWCWKNGTSFAIGENVVHEFSIFNTHVYPRSMYRALRDFIAKRHGSTFMDFISSRRGKCMHPKTLAKWSQDERTLLLSDFNLIGAFLWVYNEKSTLQISTSPRSEFHTSCVNWSSDGCRTSRGFVSNGFNTEILIVRYHMHDSVHWMATDGLDVRHDEWRREISRYAWVCQANGRRFPKDVDGQDLFKANYLAVKSAEHCRVVTQHWRNSKMLFPETRTILDTSSWQ